MTSAVILVSLLVAASAGAQQREPIIDVHVHAFGLQRTPDGRPASIPCLNDRPDCDNPPSRFTTTEAVIRGVVDAMKRHHIVKGVLLGGPMEEAYLRVDSARFIRAADDSFYGGPSPDSLRRLLESRTARVIGELVPSYVGVSPADPSFAPYFALAEEFDVPVLAHVAGIGGRFPSYRAAVSRPLSLEEVIKKHPRLRLYVENAGYPFAEDILALLYLYPNVYVDVSTITWLIPRPAFHEYLRRLVSAGFGDRVMFGTDQFGFPEITAKAVEAIETATFLTHQQKRDIFYHNAVRFFRLTPADLERH